MQLRLIDGTVRNYADLEVGDELVSPTHSVIVKHVSKQPSTSVPFYRITFSDSILGSRQLTLPSQGVWLPLTLRSQPKVDVSVDCIHVEWFSAAGRHQKDLKTPEEIAMFCVTTTPHEAPEVGTRHAFTPAQLLSRHCEGESWFEAWRPTYVSVVPYPRTRTVLDPYFVGLYSGWAASHVIELEMSSFYDLVAKLSARDTTFSNFKTFYEIFFRTDPTSEYVFNSLERRLALLAGVLDGTEASGSSFAIPLLSAATHLPCLGYVQELATGCGLRCELVGTKLQLLNGIETTLDKLPCRNGSGGGEAVKMDLKIVSVEVVNGPAVQVDFGAECDFLTKEGFVVSFH